MPDASGSEPRRYRPRNVFGEPLAEKQTQNGNRGNDCAVERNRRVVREEQRKKSNSAQQAGRHFNDRQGCEQKRNGSSQRTLSEMSAQPAQVSLSIYNFVDPRLQKQNREKQRN